MVTAEILKPCVLCAYPGSVVEITETQFRLLGNAAQELSDDAEITLLENPEAAEIPEAESATETPEKKSGRGKRKKE